MDMALVIADGTKRGRADPAFDAHMEVALHWAQAVWNQWLTTEELQKCLDYARCRVAKSPSPWSVVTGPAAAMICTLKRADWTIIDATRLVTDAGRELDLLTDPPVVVKRQMEAAVRR